MLKYKEKKKVNMVIFNTEKKLLYQKDFIARVKVPNQCKKLPTNSRAEGVLFYLDVILESTKVIQHPMQKHF